MILVVDGRDLRKMRKVLEQGWSEKTSFDGEGWRKSPYKSYGQCYVTARAVHHVLGWEILHKRSRKEDINHYWNRMPNGREVDFTSDQFEGDGMNKVEGWVGKPRSFKPIDERKTPNPRLRRYLKVVEDPLRKIKRDLESKEMGKASEGRK